MWISRTDYQGLQFKAQTLRSLAKLEQTKHVPYPDAYQKRLEYWRERAGVELKVDKHRIVVKCEEETIADLCFVDLEDAKRVYDDALSFWRASTPVDFAGLALAPQSITRIELIEATHPSPYTPAEIESWAKEKVEEEMKRWKVVLPGEGTWTIDDLRGVVKTLQTQYGPSSSLNLPWGCQFCLG